MGTRFLNPEHATYSAGKKINVSTVATSKPPIIAKAIGPQNIVEAIGRHRYDAHRIAVATQITLQFSSARASNRSVFHFIPSWASFSV